jgi:hypothetical protein
MIPRQAHMTWGIHGLPKVLLELSMPYHSTPCRRSPLKWRYGRFRGGCPQGAQPAAILLLHLIPCTILVYAQPPYDITQDALFPHDPIHLPFGPSVNEISQKIV